MKNKNEAEEAEILDWTVNVGRRLLEQGKLNKDAIMDVTNLTEEGLQLALVRKGVMDSARKLCSELTIEFINRFLELNEEELSELIKYRNKIKEEQEDDKNE